MQCKKHRNGLSGEVIGSIPFIVLKEDTSAFANFSVLGYMSEINHLSREVGEDLITEWLLN